jgi:hypothetical protein
MVEKPYAVPAVLELNNFAYGSSQALHRNISLVNPTDALRRAILVPDQALCDAAMSILFHVRSERDQAQAATGPDSEAIGDQASPFEPTLADEDENFMLAGLDSFEARNVSSFSVVLPEQSTVNIVMVFTPAVDAPERVIPVTDKAVDDQSLPPPLPLQQNSLQRVHGLVSVRFHAMSNGIHATTVRTTSPSFDEAEVRVYGRACASYIYADVTELQFGGCKAGRRYVKDFAVWNASEIETQFRISRSGPTPLEHIEFIEYETGDCVDTSRVYLPPLGHCRIRLSIQAPSQELAQGDGLWFAIENVRDARNVKYVKVMMLVTSDMVGKGIEMSSGVSTSGTILFGDCYAWEPVCRDLTLRNTFQQRVTVSVSSTLPEQVSFEVITSTLQDPHVESASGSASAAITSFGGGSGEVSQMRSSDANAIVPKADTAECGFDSSTLTVSTMAVAESSTASVNEGLRVSDEKGKNALSRPRGAANVLRTEKLEFQPGQILYLRVWYTPDLPEVAGSATSAGGFSRLRKRAFQIVFRQSAREARHVTAEANVCESVVSLSPSSLHLGDCDVLTSYTAYVTLFNLSDLPAKCRVMCESKSITPSANAIQIQPRQSFDLALKFVPRRLDPTYEKQLTIANINNRRRGETSMTIRANNVDQRGISLHAVFYKILDPSPTNEISFGRIAANYPAIRSIRIQNVTEKPVVLSFDQTDGVATFVPSWNMRRIAVVGDSRRSAMSAEGIDVMMASQSASAESQIATSTDVDNNVMNTSLALPDSKSPWPEISRTLRSLLDTETLLKLQEDTCGIGEVGEEHVADFSGASRPAISFDSIKLANFIRNCPVIPGFSAANVDEQEDVSRFVHQSLRSVEARTEQMRRWTDVDFTPLSLDAIVFSGIEEETRFADQQLKPGRTLIDAIEAGHLVRSAHIYLRGGEESVLCVALTPEDNSVQRRAIERSLFVRLVEFDSSRLEQRAKSSSWRGSTFAASSVVNRRPREVMLSVRVCKCPVKIRPMANLNFGSIIQGSQRHRYFTIDNSKSDANLVFAVRKTRSVASDDIRLGNGYDCGRLGVVRPFSVATIPFLFRPSLPGNYCERLHVVSVMDEKSSEILTIKAAVQKRSNFHVTLGGPTDFGTIDCGIESSHVVRFDVCNDTEKVRKFAISVIDRSRSSPYVPQPKVIISLHAKSAGSAPDLEADSDSPGLKEMLSKENKLKAYESKGKIAKAESLRQEIVLLRSKVMEEDTSQQAARSKLSDIVISDASMSVVHRVFEDNATFSIAEHDSQAIQVRILACKRQRLPHSVSSMSSLRLDTLDQGIPMHRRRGLASNDMYGSSDRLDAIESSAAGHVTFTLGVYETKNRDMCDSLNCSADIAPAMKRSMSTLSGSEPFAPLDEDFDGCMAPTGGREGSNLSDGEETHNSMDPLPMVDFGQIVVGQAVRRVIQISNMSDSEAMFDIIVLPGTGFTSPGLSFDAEGAPVPVGQEAVVQVSGLEAPILPQSTVTFFVSYVVLLAGKHTRTLVLQPRGNKDVSAEHRILLTARCSNGPVFSLKAEVDTVRDAATFCYPSCESARESDAESTLQLGFGVVDPNREYAIVKRVYAVSQIDVGAFLSVRSNLSFQVVLFADRALSVPASNLYVDARAKIPLWVAVAPRLRTSEILDGTARTMIGGLFLVSNVGEATKTLQISETTVRFSASVGSSPVHVNPRAIDFGSISRDSLVGDGALNGSFVLQNMSSSVEAKYSLELSSGLQLISHPRGVLAMKLPAGGSNFALPSAEDRSQSASAEEEIKICLACDLKSGLIDEFIQVRNHLSPSLSLRVSVRAFADPGDLLGSLVPRQAHDCGYKNGVVVYLRADGRDGRWLVTSGFGEMMWSIQAVSGCLKNSVTLTPHANCMFAVDTAVDGSALKPPIFPVVKTPGATWHLCGLPFSLGGCEQRRIDLRVYPLPPCNMASIDDVALRAGRVVAIPGDLILKSSDRDSAEGAMHQSSFTAVYCAPRIHFAGISTHVSYSHNAGGLFNEFQLTDWTSQTTDLGSFGHCRSWRDETVSIYVSNPTEAPIRFGFEPTLREGFFLEQVGLQAAPFSGEAESEQLWFNLAAKEQKSVTVRIRPHLISFVDKFSPGGRVECLIVIANEMNPDNVLKWILSGRLTGRRLRIEGLEAVPALTGDAGFSATREAEGTDHECLQLSLPDMFIPACTVSSNTLRLRNVSDTRVAIHVSFAADIPDETNAPGLALADLLEVDLSEHISGVDLHGAALSCQESLDIRITAVAKGLRNEALLHATAFRSADVVEQSLGVLRIGCIVGTDVEPSQAVQVKIRCKRGTSLRLTPDNLSFIGVPIRSNVVPQAQTVTISNLWSETPVQFVARMSAMLSGATCTLSPSSGWIAASESIAVTVAFARDSPLDRSSVYGATSLLVFDVTLMELEDTTLLASCPAASMAVHIHPTGHIDEIGLEDVDRNDREPSAYQLQSDFLRSATSSTTVLASLSANKATTSAESTSLSKTHLRIENLQSGKQSVSSPLPSSSRDVGPQQPTQMLPSISLPPIGCDLSQQAGVSASALENTSGNIRGDGISSSTFSLKGCTQIAGDINRYELNCGQFLATSEPYSRRLTLENTSSSSVDYKCVRDDSSWMTVNRSGGVLAPAGYRGDAHSIVFTLARDRVDIFSTYLVIETAGSEIKTVRVQMEVVADGSVDGTADSYFSVLADGRGADSRFIDYSSVMLGQLYRHRSFVVRNKSSVGLEFMLSHDLPGSAKSEASFSLTNAVLRKTTRLVIPPNETRRVFIFYQPRLEPTDPVEAGDDSVFDRVFSVSVTARLVKDYQLNVKILSRCRKPNLSIAKTDFLFDCTEIVASALTGHQGVGVSAVRASGSHGDGSETDENNRNSTPRSRSPAQQLLPAYSLGTLAVNDGMSVPNVGEVVPSSAALAIITKIPSRVLVYTVRNSSRFFDVDCVGDVELVGSGTGRDEHCVRIRPNISRIRERALFFARERYVEEHVTVYNRCYPREFWWVSLKLICGGVANDYSALRHNRAFAFSSLESTVCTFLSRFSSFWTQFRRDVFAPNEGNRGRQDEAGESDESDIMTAWAACVAKASESQGYDDVLFEMHYATDELIQFMLKSTTQTATELASVLYGYVFRHDAFSTFLLPEGQALIVPELLYCWVGQLGHFLSFFPDKRDQFRKLTDLEDRFKERIDTSLLRTPRIN